jgi:hypothetical protein
MKYVVSLVFGLILGTGVALALLYFNPLTQHQSAPLSNPEQTLAYKLTGADVWLSTHDDRIELPVVPKGVSLLYEDGIRGTWLSALGLTDKSLPGLAAATRISVPSRESELLRSGLLVEDFWLISVPGTGSMFVHAMSNQWPLLRDTVVNVDWLGREFNGPAAYDPTRGPASGNAEVFGLTGAYGGSEGRAREHLSLESYDGGLAALSGQLAIRMVESRSGD